MIIGIVGKGIVGNATGFAFEKLGHMVKYHDIKLNTQLRDLFDCEIIYICVPTPSREDGSCNTDIVESVLDELHIETLRETKWGNISENAYTGIIVIKSTVEPGFTNRMIEKYHNCYIAHVSEYLRESSAISDAVENVKLLPIGTVDETGHVFDKIVESFGDYPQCVMKMTPLEDELLKYIHNCFNALRIGFANEWYSLCEALGANYPTIKKGLLKTSGMPNMYLDVTPQFKGFAGPCLPKDLAAIIALAKKHNVNMGILEALQKLNDSLPKSVFPGMRES